ncbi:MAG: FAD-dependent oxidoreductase [Bacteroidetes bacterium]|nr:MAG: FAD-dependent oxidoreductase [Bacteroidota bacterium]
MKIRLTAILAVLFVFSTACQSLYGDTTQVAYPTVSPDDDNTVIDTAEVIVVGGSLAGFSAAVSAARELDYYNNPGKVIWLADIDYRCLGGQATCAQVSMWDQKAVDPAVGNDYWLQQSMNGEYDKAGVQYQCRAAHTFCPNPRDLEAEIRAWATYWNIEVIFTKIHQIVPGMLTSKVVTGIGTFVSDVVVEATEDGSMIPASMSWQPQCQQPDTLAYMIVPPNEPHDGLISEFKNYGYPDLSQQAKDYLLGNDPQTPEFLRFNGYRYTVSLRGNDGYGLNRFNDAYTYENAKDKTYQQLSFLANQPQYANWAYLKPYYLYNRTSEYRLIGKYHKTNAPRGVNSHYFSIAVFGYRADSHGGCDVNATEPDGQYDFPAWSCMPANGTNFLVAMPRSCDISDLVASSARMQPDELDAGEGIGLLAATAAHYNINVTNVSPELVMSRLEQVGQKVKVDG